MRRRPLQSLSSERGAILIFVLLAVVFLFMIGGLAIDYAHMFVADKELEKAMDAAALAGAGKLGFNDTAFPVARQFAQLFANKNDYRVGAITLDPNVSNAAPPLDSMPTPHGDVILGVWDPTLPEGVGAGRRFAPSLDGTIVNAVMCRFKTEVNTSLFRLWGINTMPISAVSVATANPPATPPPDACLFPVGVGDCPFQGETSLGCGATLTFISSSGQGGAGCLAPPCTNTAAWVNLANPGATPTPPQLNEMINDAASGNCAASSLQVGDDIATNNGMAQVVFSNLTTKFQQVWAESPIHTITDVGSNVTYEGKGWKVYLPVIDTECPAGAIEGSREIIGWTEFVITQVINGGQCAVANHWLPPGQSTNPWDPIGQTPNCHGTNSPGNVGSLRAIFGYYSCTIIPSNPVPVPVPRSALADKLRLVR
jgi:hypothetical protein